MSSDIEFETMMRELDDRQNQASSLVLTPVEIPGGGRIKVLTPPKPSELVTITGAGGKTIQLHHLAAKAWDALAKAARADGIKSPLLLPTSGYRSVERQRQLWEEARKKHGTPENARKWVAPPGGSAHQTGRAIDFYLGGSNKSENVESLRTFPAYKWLVTNALRFGFYPYEREPWHWEYNPPSDSKMQKANVQSSQVGSPATEPSSYQQMQNLLRKGMLTAEVAFALISGERDENRLANILFYSRYPELQNQKLARSDPKAQDWIRIRNEIVRPILAKISSSKSSAAGVTSAPLRADQYRWQSVKHELARIATNEFTNTWKSGTRKESESAMHPIIRTYWSEGVYEGRQVPAYIKVPDTAWSAAFIAWVVGKAGGRDRFSKFGAEQQYRSGYRPTAHYRYLAAAKYNRENKQYDNPFWAYRVNELKPEIGDIVIKSRSGSNATFDNFEGRKTHGDIVVEVRAKEMVVIGGNVSNSVSRRIYLLDANGFIKRTGEGNDHFAIIRIRTD
jgi:hypothetical protein